MSEHVRGIILSLAVLRSLWSATHPTIDSRAEVAGEAHGPRTREPANPRGVAWLGQPQPSGGDLEMRALTSRGDPVGRDSPERLSGAL